MRFSELNINPRLMQKAREQGFEELTLIQRRSIPEILVGKDVVGQAETGSGKTIAFGLPILEKIVPRGGLQTLILTPTRELCVQVTDVLRDFGRQIGVSTTSVYGGVGIEPQIKSLRTADIAVGTPGRILDHIGRRTIDLSKVRFLVLDETDRMLDMGFIDDVEEIIRHVPRERQTLMFSATIYEDINMIMRRHLRNPVIIRTQSQVDSSKLRQVFYDIHYQSDKFSLLLHLLKNSTPGLALVFCGTRTESDIVEKNLRRQGINAMAIHGGMSQQKREESLGALKSETTDVLVATDVAARGLDIKNITHVYNYDVPKTAKEYIHRIGRTARAGENGDAVTLLTSRDHDNFRRIGRDMEAQIEIERAEMPHFKRVPFDRMHDESRRSFGGRRFDDRGRGRGGSRGPGRWHRGRR
ncbi:MAG: DEAD/DEAH box helicase [Candidatus Aenigmarchaeota archaeon]|nr:DEAD/DEAH box helicase [Candidatus Aenigmarchaeota archaeon]